VSAKINPMKMTKYWSGTILMLIFLFTLAIPAKAQKKRWKDYLITGTSMLASGALDGTIETISYHYESGFRPHFRNINDQFWNPAVSWKNKYKNGDPCYGPKFTGSTTFFVGATDGYHMLRGTKRMLGAGTLAYYMNQTCQETHLTRKQRTKRMVTDFLVLSAIRCVGFTLTYSVVFKPVKQY
jgi:hypothetical protein